MMESGAHSSDCEQPVQMEESTDESNKFVNKDPLSELSSVSSIPSYCPNPNLTVTDITAILTDQIKQQSQDILQAFRSYDRLNTGKVLRSQLKQVLRMFCVPMTAAQFNALALGVPTDKKGKINYAEFLKQISGFPITADNLSLAKSVPDQLPIDELELRIKCLISSNLRNVIKALWLYDFNKDGMIQKRELRNVLENYCLKMNDNQYNELWQRHDRQKSGLISYKDFLIKLGISVERYKTYMPRESVAKAFIWMEQSADDFVDNNIKEQRTKRAALEGTDDPSIKGLAIEETEKKFRKELLGKHDVLECAFKMFDPSNTGKIHIKDFYSALNFFVLPMSPGLFDQIMDRFGVTCSPPPSKNLNWHNFLKDFCNPDPFLGQLSSQENLSVEKCARVIERIKKTVTSPEARLRTVFTTFDKDDRREVTKPELRKALETGLEFQFTDDEFKELMQVLDPYHTNLVKCDEFLKLFEYDIGKLARKKYVMKPQTDNSGLVPRTGAYSNLHGAKLKSKLRLKINRNMKNIEKAFLTCDLDRCALVSPYQFRKVLENFCFPLNDDQFNEILQDSNIFRERLNYQEFLELYKKKANEDMDLWIKTINKLAPFKSSEPTSLSPEEADELLREAVKVKHKSMLQDFMILDTCKVNIAYKDDVRRIFNKYIFRMNNEQFKKLWEKFPKNRFGQLKYRDFLKQYSKDISEYGNLSSSSSLSSSPSKAGSIKPEPPTNTVDNIPDEEIQRRKKEMLHKAANIRRKSRIVSKENYGKPPPGNTNVQDIIEHGLPTLKKTFASMRIPILKGFRELRHRFRRIDPKMTSIVNITEFQTILRQSGVYLNDEEMFHLLEYFDPDLKGLINYKDFLRMFIWYA